MKTAAPLPLANAASTGSARRSRVEPVSAQREALSAWLLRWSLRLFFKTQSARAALRRQADFIVQHRASKPAALLALLALLQGCASIGSGAAGIAQTVIENHVVPTALNLDDADVACGLGLTTLPLVETLQRFDRDPALIESVLLFSASVCSDNRAVEHELRSLRAFRDKRSDESLDARTAQQREQIISGRRQLASFEQMRAGLERRYTFSYGVTCPVFNRNIDEFTYLIGSIAGVRAVTNDLATKNSLNVSMDIPASVDAAMKCLDNSRWWGAPQALRAVIWSIIPGGANGQDIGLVFDQSMTLGEQSGMRVAHLMAVLAAVSTDDQVALRNTIRRFAKSRPASDDAPYRIVDAIVQLEMQSQSDRLWTRLTGARTPIGALGRFPDDAAAPALDVDNFLK